VKPAGSLPAGFTHFTNYNDNMKPIHTQEEAVMAALKTITLKNDKDKITVPVIYGNLEKCEAFIKSEKGDSVLPKIPETLRTPVIGWHTKKIKKNSIELKGWIFATKESDLKLMIQELYCVEVEDANTGVNNLCVSSATIKRKEILGHKLVAAKFRATLRM
jgi:hypothetical protein